MVLKMNRNIAIPNNMNKTLCTYYYTICKQQTYLINTPNGLII